jgi:hypothetical protein
MKTELPPHEIKAGDKFQLLCDHKGCKRYLTMTMQHPSVGYASHKKLGNIDLRNQVWFCFQHRGKNG